MYRVSNLYTDRSSASASAQRKSSSYGVSITLSSNRSPYDKRVLNLTPGQNAIIGRASRSEVKGLQASGDNALFDCPVVSRLHAEFRLSAWDVPHKRVTITDRSSLHGTTVNGTKLIPGHDFPLQSGDIIKLGEKVTRGEDIHDGVSLTFTDSTSSPPSRGHFEVPYHSEEEEDEISDSLDERESVRSSEDAVSSAHTTPEQTKMMLLGSQERPMIIDSEDANTDRVSGGKGLMNTGPPVSGQEPQPRVIPDSYQDNLSLSKSSFAQSTQSSAFIETVDIASDNESDDAEGTDLHDIGVSRLRGHDSHRQADEETRMEDSDVEDEDAEYDPLEHDGADVLSDSGASNLSKAASEADDEWPVHRRVSLELGVTEEPPTTLGNFTVNPSQSFHSPAPMPFFTIPPPASASKPRYDPVRNLPSREEPETTTSRSEPRKNISPYMLPYAYGSNMANRATEVLAPWDQPAVHPISFTDQQPQLPSNGNIWSTLPGPYPTRDAPSASSFEWAFSQPAAVESVNVNMPMTKGKISIPDIVEEHHATDLAPKASEPAPELAPTTGKRKATEIEEETPTEAYMPSPKKTKSTEDETAPVARVRPRRKARCGTVRRVASSAAHLATGAVLGVVGFAWFATSDYSQQLLDWLA